MLGELFGFFLVVDGADGLRRVLEGGIFRVNLRLREDRRERGGLRHVVDEFLLDHVADHADRFSTDHVERIHRHLLVGIVLESKKADLRAVAVRDHELVAFVGLGDLLAGEGNVFALVFAEHRLTALQKGIAAQSNNKTHD